MSVWGDDSSWGLSSPWGGAIIPGGGAYSPLTSVTSAPGGNSPLGTDIICFYDLDPYFSLVSGVNCLAQDLFHSITTQNGSLAYDLSYGIDIRQQLNGSVTSQTLSNLSAAINFQIQNDDRVQTSTCVLNWDNITSTLTGNINVIPAVGVPFQFVVAASALSVSLLSVIPASV